MFVVGISTLALSRIRDLLAGDTHVLDLLEEHLRSCTIMEVDMRTCAHRILRGNLQFDLALACLDDDLRFTDHVIGRDAALVVIPQTNHHRDRGSTAALGVIIRNKQAKGFATGFFVPDGVRLVLEVRRACEIDIGPLIVDDREAEIRI